jgi:hypothetical protein
MGNDLQKRKSLYIKIVTGVLMFSYIIIGFIDLMMNNKPTYSTVMGMDIDRVYFYSFFLLTIGCWLLYHKWFVGIGFILLGTFNSYFPEFLDIHNYFASIAIYVVAIIDFVIRKKVKWLIPLVILGIIQGLAFHFGWFDIYLTGAMEFAALFLGTIYIVKLI